MRPVFCAVALSGAVLLGGCSMKRTAVRYTADVMQAGMPVFMEEGDALTAMDGLLPTLKLAEGMERSDPGNPELALLLSQGYCAYAFMFLEDSDPSRASAMFAKGESFTRVLLEKRGLLNNGRPTGKPIARKDVPAYFWNTFCRASRAQLSLEDTEVIADIPRLEAAADELLKTAPDFYYGGPYTLRAALYAKKPRMMGGDPEKARALFEKALSGPGQRSLLNKFLYAKLYAPAVLDKDLFVKLLQEVVSAQDDCAELRLSNTVVKEKAAKLKERADEIF